jgi:hypothetical protein
MKIFQITVCKRGKIPLLHGNFLFNDFGIDNVIVAFGILISGRRRRGAGTGLFGATFVVAGNGQCTAKHRYQY